MHNPLLDTPLGQLACEIPGATMVLRRHQLDFCCGGQQRLGDVLRQRGQDPQPLLDELQALGRQAQPATDWRSQPLPVLIEHILSRYHDRHRRQLPELIRLARRVEQVHGGRPGCPEGLAEHLDGMLQELESHMLKEEQILFPMIQQGLGSQAGGPLAVMRFEHDQHGEALAGMVALSHGMQPPAHACNTWRALYSGLRELHEDLTEHIHLENNILFPRAERGVAA